MIEANEKKLIQRLKKGDEKAFKKLYRLHRKSCKKWLENHFDADNQLCEDVFQDAVIILYEAARDGKLDEIGCTIKTYLFAICRNQMLGHFKLQKRQDDQVDQVLVYQREWLNEENGDQENVALVKRAMDETKEPCRTILTLYYYQGFDLEEIADILGYANKNVLKVQKSRCLGYLKEKVWKR